jgi:hypothetical protein
MQLVVQNVLVGLIVITCTFFSAWRLMSPSMRLRTLELVAPAATKLGAGGALTRLRSKVVAQLAAGCSACSHSRTAVLRTKSGRQERSA